MKLTTLIDNKQNINQLKCEHGLSFHLETSKLNIIFDTGQSDKLITNAQKLGIDISAVDYIVLSHGHYDHCGGLPYLFENNTKTKAIISSRAFKERFSRSTAMVKPNGIPWRDNMDAFSDRLLLIDDDYKLDDDLTIFTNIGTQKGYEIVNERLVVKKDGNLVPDMFDDELVLMAHTKSKPLVLCGCSHTGIINILHTIKERTGNNAFSLIAGGLHLNGCTTEEAEHVLSGLSPFEIDNWALNHCTGDKAFELFKQNYPGKVNYCGGGYSIVL